MSTFPAPWALCGGWAVDAWLGRQTREHGDVDIAVFIQDQKALFEHLRDWQLIAHAPGAAVEENERWDGRHLNLPVHIHGRLDKGEAIPSGVLTQEQGFSLDIQFGNRDADEWVLSTRPRIGLPIADAFRESSWGLPTVVPHVLLFFKGGDLRWQDRADFLGLRPHLARGQQDWLRDAISLVGHPWLAELSD